MTPVPPLYIPRHEAGVIADDHHHGHRPEAVENRKVRSPENVSNISVGPLHSALLNADAHGVGRVDSAQGPRLAATGICPSTSVEYICW